jgi:hypothetical protein
MHDGEPEEIRNISDHIDELLYREEMLWLQRSRIAWLRTPVFFIKRQFGVLERTR